MQDLDRLLSLYNAGRVDEVIARGEALAANLPGSALVQNVLGAAYSQRGRRAEAEARFRRAVELDPELAAAHSNLGGVLVELGRRAEAMACFERALALNPNYAQAHNNLGFLLREEGRVAEALTAFERAVALNADYAEAHNNLGMCLAELGRTREAVESYRRALGINPNYAQPHNNWGNALMALGEREEAMAHFRIALQIDPRYAGAHANLGLALREARRHEEAAASFERALALKADADVYLSLGVSLAELRRPDEAIAAFTRALELKPDQAAALAQRLHQQARICDWDGVEAHRARIAALGVTDGVVPPFAMLALEDAPGRHRLRAERFAREMYKQAPLPAPARPKTPPARLRIGYFSADFHDHATMYLMAKLFELHDRGRFALHGYSYGPDKNDAMRARAVAAFDVFHDVRALGDKTIAELARSEGIDIAVNLKGYTEGGRSGVFAYRAAPIQINYLGYPGTMGADFIDYLIADAVVTPAALRAHYSESIITLPHSYQVNDDTRAIGARPASRTEAGLPERGFVFCCFNNNYKITAAEFDVWMRLLQRVQGSVLWLLKTDASAEGNLRRAAEARGVAGERLLFAAHVPLAEHLARNRLADLFLDTFNYNAHTTASDALWARLPLLTKLGEGFAARVAGSLLSAVGLPELVTTSVDEYERLALELATTPAKLAGVHAKLAANRATAPLFDTALFARHIEAAYERAYARYLNGEAPADIVIEP